jgi:hypothetical protein
MLLVATQITNNKRWYFFMILVQMQLNCIPIRNRGGHCLKQSKTIRTILLGTFVGVGLGECVVYCVCVDRHVRVCVCA